MLAPLLRELAIEADPRAVDVVASRAVRERYRRNDRIYSQGDPADGMHVVGHGCVLLEWYSAHDVLTAFRLAGSGESFGLRSFCANEPRSTTARALTATLTLHVRTPILQEAAAIDPRVYRCFARAVARDRGPEISKVARNGRIPVTVRFASLLVELARHLPRGSGDGTERIDFPVMQKDLAKMLNVKQETVSRALQQFRQAGLVDLGHGPRQLMITDPSRLMELAKTRL